MLDKHVSKRPRVVIVHPGRQHSYETALAAQQAGMLERFITGPYHRNGALPVALEKLGAPGRHLAGILRRRRHLDLDLSFVDSVSRYHLGGLLAMPVAQFAGLERWLNPSVEAAFDREASRRIRMYPRDVIIHGFEGGCATTLAAANRAGHPTVLDVPSAHEDFVALEGGTDVVAERIGAERAAATVLLAPSAHVAACLANAGVPRQRILLLPYGVDVERFRPQPRPSTGGLRVLFVGNLPVRKGLNVLLDAWRRAALPDGELAIVGDLPSAWRKQCLSVPGVKVVGKVSTDEVDRWFAWAHVVSVPSLAEGSALVTYEAMAAGCALFVTPNAGSVATQGREALILPARDVNAWSDALWQAHADRDLVDRLGRNGRKLMIERFTWHHYRRRLVAIWSALAKDAAPASAASALAAAG